MITCAEGSEPPSFYSHDLLEGAGSRLKCDTCAIFGIRGCSDGSTFANSSCFGSIFCPGRSRPGVGGPPRASPRFISSWEPGPFSQNEESSTNILPEHFEEFGFIKKSEDTNEHKYNMYRQKAIMYHEKYMHLRQKYEK